MATKGLNFVGTGIICASPLAPKPRALLARQLPATHRRHPLMPDAFTPIMSPT